MTIDESYGAGAVIITLMIINIVIIMIMVSFNHTKISIKALRSNTQPARWNVEYVNSVASTRKSYIKGGDEFYNLSLSSLPVCIFIHCEKHVISNSLKIIPNLSVGDNSFKFKVLWLKSPVTNESGSDTQTLHEL